MTRAEKAERQKAIEDLRKLLQPGMRLHTVLRHVSRSGMSRLVDVYLLQGGEARYLSWSVSRASGFPLDNRREAIRVGGCGMDVGFEVVYNLSRALWPNGFECIGEGCPSNDHSNGDTDRTPHHHADGGYALRHQWL